MGDTLWVPKFARPDASKQTIAVPWPMTAESGRTISGGPRTLARRCGTQPASVCWSAANRWLPPGQAVDLWFGDGHGPAVKGPPRASLPSGIGPRSLRMVLANALPNPRISNCELSLQAAPHPTEILRGRRPRSRPRMDETTAQAGQGGPRDLAGRNPAIRRRPRDGPDDTQGAPLPAGFSSRGCRDLQRQVDETRAQAGSAFTAPRCGFQAGEQRNPCALNTHRF